LQYADGARSERETSEDALEEGLQLGDMGDDGSLVAESDAI
jgi:hypothetical protein